MKVRFIINPTAGGSNKTERITDGVREVLNATGGLFEIRAAIPSKDDDGDLHSFTATSAW